jgi:sigma-54-specific transcriptional regulator
VAGNPIILVNMSKFVITLPNRTQPYRARVMVFEDPKSQALLKRLRLIAPSGANALIIGETGTGKELIARHIHDLSPRAKEPFVAVNCGAFSENLIESELFGHEKGAFTGAIASKQGWFEVAHGGTLFLDEIGDLSLPLQVKLLRVLQERQVVRVGAREPVDIDVRVVAATNVKLEEAVSTGRFREDLYYRLNVASLFLAPLRERPGDILPLAEHFRESYSARLALNGIQFSPEAAENLITGHTWPGNIRELENVIHHALLVCRGKVIRPEDLNLNVLSRPALGAGSSAAALNGDEKLRQALLSLFEEGHGGLYDRIEETVMRVAYDYCHRNQLETARLLEISRNIVRARLMKGGDLQPRKRTPLEATVS